MEFDPEVVKATSQIATQVGKKSVEAIFDKIRTVKKKGNQEEVVNSLEEIINELISDKNQLIQLTQVYEEQLITQKLSENDIDYISKTIVPLLENLLHNSNNQDAEQIRQTLNLFNPILSKETFNILQILGFNFKQAIGEPLTELVKSFISTKIPPPVTSTLELEILSEQKQLAYLQIAQNEEQYQRLLKILGRQ